MKKKNSKLLNSSSTHVPKKIASGKSSPFSVQSTGVDRGRGCSAWTLRSPYNLQAENTEILIHRVNNEKKSTAIVASYRKQIIRMNSLVCWPPTYDHFVVLICELGLFLCCRFTSLSDVCPVFTALGLVIAVLSENCTAQPSLQQSWKKKWLTSLNRLVL